MSNTDAILSNKKNLPDSISSASKECREKDNKENLGRVFQTDSEIKIAIDENRTWLAENFGNYDFINFLSEQLGNGDLRLMSIIEKHVSIEAVSKDCRLMQKFDKFCFKKLQNYL